MNFSLQRHCRLAGCAALFIGLFINNWTLVAVGNLIVVVGYMWTVAKVETFIESLNNKMEDQDNASD